MERKNLKYLSKEELIDIVLSNDFTKRRAFLKTVEKVETKIIDILKRQERCDLTTATGLFEYTELEEEYKKWSKIQENL